MFDKKRELTEEENFKHKLYITNKIVGLSNKLRWMSALENCTHCGYCGAFKDDMTLEEFKSLPYGLNNIDEHYDWIIKNILPNVIKELNERVQ